jgi:hypothetical protein
MVVGWLVAGLAAAAKALVVMEAVEMAVEGMERSVFRRQRSVTHPKSYLHQVALRLQIATAD